MEINQQEILALLGGNAVEIYLLKKKVSELLAHIAELEKPKEPE